MSLKVKIEELKKLHDERVAMEEGLKTVQTAIDTLLDDLKGDLEDGYTCDRFSLRPSFKYNYSVKDKGMAEEMGMYKPRYYLDEIKLKQAYEDAGTTVELNGIVISREPKLVLYSKKVKLI